MKVAAFKKHLTEPYAEAVQSGTFTPCTILSIGLQEVVSENEVILKGATVQVCTFLSSPLLASNS